MASLFLIFSNVALWTLVLLLFGAVFVLYRHVGQQLTDSPEGRLAQGPEPGTRLPDVRLMDVRGKHVELANGTLPTFLLFVSTSCEPCLEILPYFRAFADDHRGSLQHVIMTRGNTDSEVDEFARQFGRNVRVVADNGWKLGSRLRITATPFAVLADANAVVRAKGLPGAYERLQWFVEQLAVAEGQHAESVQVISQYAD